MISIKFKVEEKEFLLRNTTKTRSPGLIIGFNESVKPLGFKESSDYRNKYEPPTDWEKQVSNGTGVRIDHNDNNTYEICGMIPEESLDTACLLFVVLMPQLEEDGFAVYHRLSENVVSYCNDIDTGRYEVICKDSCGNYVAKYHITVTECIKNNSDNPFINYKTSNGLVINGKSVKETRSLFSSLPFQKQKEYEMKMTKFLKDRFKYEFKGCDDMSLLNNNYGIHGKSPFYQFAAIEIPYTNEAYWQQLFDLVLLLKYGIEKNKGESHGDFWKRLSVDERISLLMDMVFIASVAAYYLSDFVQNKNGTERTPTEDFCAIFLTWTGDCVATYQEIYMADGTLRKVGDLHVGDRVLSYDLVRKEYCTKRVTKIWEKGDLSLYRVHFRNGTSIDVTKNHPMWCKSNSNHTESKYEKTLLSDIDLDHKHRKRVPLSTSLPYIAKDIPNITSELCFVIGHYLAEGWCEEHKVTTSGYEIPEYIVPILKEHDIPYTEYTNNSNVPCLRFLSSWFKDYLHGLKRSSFDIRLYDELTILPINKLEMILEGYFVGDGHYHARGKNEDYEKIYTTSCELFADQLMDISLKVGTPFYKYRQEHHGGLGKKPIYRLHDNDNSTFRQDRGYEGLGEVVITEIERLGVKEPVRDFEVEDTHTYIFKNGTLGHNCEDLGQFAIILYRIFRKCKISGDETNSPLKWLQMISRYYTLFFCLCSAERSNAGSKTDALSLHMCDMLIRKGFLKSNMNVQKFDNKEDAQSFFHMFEHYNNGKDRESVVLNGIEVELKTFFIGEGTGFVKSLPSNQKQSNLDQYVGKNESIKERMFIREGKPDFYIHMFMILTNSFIDNDLGIPIYIESFIMTYDPKRNKEVDPSFDENSMIYGVKIEDLLKHEDWIQIIPTPSIDDVTVKLTKKLSTIKLGVPPCVYSKEKDMFMNPYVVDNIYPIISPTELDEIKRVCSEFILEDPFDAISKYDGKLALMLVPPRILPRILGNVPKKNVFGLTFPRIFTDLYIVPLWIRE